MNDLDLCLEVVSRSRQPMHYIWRWISRKPLEIEAWFQRTTNIGNGMWAIEWSRDRWRHVTLKGQTRDPNTLAISLKLLELETAKWYAALYGKCRAGAQKISPKSGRGLGHVTPTIFGILSNISPKLLELETSNLVRGLYGACQIADRTHKTNDLDLCLEIALIKFCAPNICPYHDNELSSGSRDHVINWYISLFPVFTHT